MTQKFKNITREKDLMVIEEVIEDQEAEEEEKPSSLLKRSPTSPLPTLMGLGDANRFKS
jgi:hypothetical protein